MDNDLAGIDDPSTIEPSSLDNNITQDQSDLQGNGDLLQGADGSLGVGDYTDLGGKANQFLYLTVNTHSIASQLSSGLYSHPL